MQELLHGFEDSDSKMLQRGGVRRMRRRREVFMRLDSEENLVTSRMNAAPTIWQVKQKRMLRLEGQTNKK